MSLTPASMSALRRMLWLGVALAFATLTFAYVAAVNGSRPTTASDPLAHGTGGGAAPASGFAAPGPLVRQLPTHGERVPDLAESFTVASVTSGTWSDPAIWSTGRVPGDDEVVRIAPGTVVGYDLVSDVALKAVGVAGTLTFRTDVATRLRVTHLLVYRDGTLLAGDEARPIGASVEAEIVINDRPLEAGSVEAPGIDPAQFGNGVLVWGRLSLRGADRLPAFARLAAEARAGDTTLGLAPPLRGWRPGDRLFLPDSRLIADADLASVASAPYNLPGSRGLVAQPHWEVAEVAAVDRAGVTLVHPLRFDHRGAHDEQGLVARAAGISLLPHVANLSRNIVIRSEHPEGVRGHIIGFHGASMSMVNVRVAGLGRTTVAPLDSTAWDADGRLVHVGTNQLARYPIHMHHVNDAVSTASEPAFRVSGTVVEDARRWGISVHGSHGGLVSDNVVVDLDGAGIVTEDGSETGNRFEGNFVGAVRGSGQPVDARRARDGVGHEGAGFWFGSDNNLVVHNVVAGVRDGGFTLFRTPEALPFAAATGGDTGGARTIERVFAFEGNEVYGAAETGIELWDSKDCAACRASPAVLRDTVVWHSRNGVTYDYHSDFYRIDRLVVRGDPVNMAGTTGVRGNASRRVTIARADIAHVGCGLDVGGLRNRHTDVADTTIRAAVGIRIRRGTSWDRDAAATFARVQIAAAEVSGAKLIELDTTAPAKGAVTLAIRRPVYFTAFQGRAGADFQLFFPDQASGVAISENADAALGCPEAGLTNAECFSRHGIAIGGELATCETTVAGVDGFTCPLPAGASTTNH